MKSKKIIVSSVACILVACGLAYYFFSYAPHQRATEAFDKAVKIVKKKNSELEKLIASSEKSLKSKEEPLDSKTKEALEKALADSKEDLRKIPKIKSSTKAIEKQVEALKEPLDYTQTQKNLAEKKKAFQDSIKQLKQITNPNSNFVESRLKEVSSITGVQSVTESNDPNGLLKKQGGYTASVYFTDNQVTTSVEGADIVAKGNDAGGNIEVYPTKEEAEKRNIYLSAFDGNGILNPGSHYVYGTLVIRTSQYLTGSQQTALTKSIYEKLTELK